MYGMEQQKAAVLSGYWPLFRYNPAWAKEGGKPLQLDSRPPTIPLEKYMNNETRFTILGQSDPGMAKKLLNQAQQDVMKRWRLYEQFASLLCSEAETVAERAVAAQER